MRNYMPRWKLDRARNMRKHPTDAEALLWQALRRKQIHGVKFRRQARMFGYIADFHAPAISLIVEVDGAYHATRRTADRERDARLEARGILTLRVSNEEVQSGAARDLVALCVSGLLDAHRAA